MSMQCYTTATSTTHCHYCFNSWFLLLPLLIIYANAIAISNLDADAIVKITVFPIDWWSDTLQMELHWKFPYAVPYLWDKKIEIKVFQQMLYHVGDVFEPFMPRTISKQLKTMKEWSCIKTNGHLLLLIVRFQR